MWHTVWPVEYDTHGEAICVGTFLDGVIENTVQMWIGDPDYGLIGATSGFT